MADKENFAKWLTDNVHLKGTPEWDSVAKAFTEVDMVSTTTLPTSQSVKGPSDLGSAAINSIDTFQDMIGRSGVTLGQSLKKVGPAWQNFQEGTQDLITKYTGLKPAKEPGAITKYLQQSGNKFTPYGEEWGQQLSDYGDAQSAFNKKQIEERNYVSPYKDGLRETYNEGTLKDTLGWLTWRTTENAASLGSSVGGVVATALTAPVSIPLSWMIGGATIGVNTLATMGEVGKESDEKLGRENANHTSELMFGMLNGLLDRFGAKGVIPANKLRKMGYAEVIEFLTKKKKFAAVKAINKALLREGVTEGIQDGNAMLNAYINGGVYEKQEVIDRLIDSAAVGAAGGAAVSTTIESGKKVGGAAKWVGSGFTSPADMTEEDVRAAGSYAQRLQNIIDGDPKARVKNIKKTATFGAREIVDQSHVELSEEITDLWKDLKIEVSKPKNSRDEADLARIDRIMSKVAYRASKNKTKNSVYEKDFQALERTVGSTEKGQKLIQLMRESNQMTELHNSGYKGGVSKFTDIFLPFSNAPSYAASNVLSKAAGLATGAAIYSAAGAPGLVAQAGVGASGRFIDALTGRRSRVAKYIKDNKKLPSFKPATGDLTLAEQKELAVEEKSKKTTAVRKQGFENGVQPELPNENQSNSPSPRGWMWDAAGFAENGKRVDNRDTGELDEEIITLINDAVLMNPELREVADSYIKNTPLGKNPEGDLGELLTTVRAVVQTNSQSAPNVQTEVGSGFGSNIVGAKASGYNRGIEDNKAAVADLTKRANEDTSLSTKDKALINTALATLSSNLGGDPMTTSQQVLDGLLENDVNPQAADMYVKPYVDRIANQQNTAPKLGEVVNETMEAPIIESSTLESKGPKVPEYQPPSLVQKVLEDTSSGFTAFRNPTEVSEKRNLLEIGDVLEQKQKQLHGRTLDFVGDEGDFNLVVEGALEEFDFEVNENPGALEWYDDDVKQTIDTLSEVIPELRQDNANPDATLRNRAMLTLLTSLTSVGQKPKLNIKYGAALAKHYFETGEVGLDGEVFSEKRGVTEPRVVHPVTGKLLGQKAGSIEPNLHLMRQMISDMGFEGFIAYIHSTRTVKELNDLRAKTFNPATGKNMGKASHLKGGMTAEYPAIYLFGPKVGPFFNNLNGIEDETVDLWATRLIHQHAGGLKNPLYKGKDDKKNSQLTDSPTSVNRNAMKDVFRAVAERKGLRSSQQAQAVLWSASQNLYRDLGGTASNEYFSEGAKEYVEQDVNSRERQDVGSPIRDGNVEGGILKSQTPAVPGSGLPGAALSTPSTSLSLQEVKPHLQPAKEVFEIGKEGSEFENGVDTMEKAQRLANALNVSIELLDKLPGGSSGSYANYRNEVGGIIKALRKGSDHPAYSGEVITEIEELSTTLHELAHSLTRPRIDREVTPVGEIGSRNNPLVNQQSKAANLSVHRGSFEDFILDATGLNNEEQIAVIKEIINLQENADYIFENRPELGKTEIRAFRRTREVTLRNAETESLKVIEKQLSEPNLLNMAPHTKAKIIRDFVASEKKTMNKAVDKALKSHRMTYARDVNELAVDPLLLYLANPKMAKKLAPTVSKKIRYLFNNFGGPKNPVTFYTFPLATILAIVMASLAARDKDDEERDRLTQIPPGALTPNQGALSGMMA
jgi:hypothetical protein